MNADNCLVDKMNKEDGEKYSLLYALHLLEKGKGALDFNRFVKQEEEKTKTKNR